MIAKLKQPFLLQYARQDEFTSTERVHEMEAASLSHEILKIYDTTHAMDLPQVEQDRVEWLAKQPG